MKPTFIVRLAALALLPCLVADPITASASALNLNSRSDSRLSPPLFTSQALIETLGSFANRRFLAKTNLKEIIYRALKSATARPGTSGLRWLRGKIRLRRIDREMNALNIIQMGNAAKELLSAFSAARKTMKSEISFQHLPPFTEDALIAEHVAGVIATDHSYPYLWLLWRSLRAEIDSHHMAIDPTDRSETRSELNRLYALSTALKRELDRTPTTGVEKILHDSVEGADTILNAVYKKVDETAPWTSVADMAQVGLALKAEHGPLSDFSIP